MVSFSSHIKCMSLTNQKRMTQATLINLYLNECSQELHHYPFVVDLNMYVGTCSTLKDLCSRVCVPSEKKYLNFHVLSMIAGISISRTVMKHMSWKCECNFDRKKCNSNQKWNNNKCWCEWKYLRHCVCEKNIFGILQHVVGKTVNVYYWQLLTIQWLGMMKLWKKQKLFQPKVLQQKLF